MRKLIVDLDHIDGAIRLFDPGYDIAGIRDKPVRPVQLARRGDSIRLILDLLREATEPMTTKQIALQFMAHRGLNAMDGALVLTMTCRVGASLRTSRDNGSVRSIKDGRYGKYDLWEIPRSWTIRGGGSALGHSEHMSQAKRAVISGDVGNNSDLCEIPSPTLLKQEISVDVIERFRCR